MPNTAGLEICLSFPRLMWAKTGHRLEAQNIHNFSRPTLEPRRLRPRCSKVVLPPQAPGRGLPASSSSGGPRRPWAGGCVPPISASVSTWLLLWVCVSSSVSSQDTVIGCRAPLTQDDLLSDPPLIPPAKALFPDKDLFPGSTST